MWRLNNFKRNIRPYVNNIRRHFSDDSSSNPPKASPNRGPVTFLSLGLMAAVGGLIIFYYDLEKENKIKQVAKEVKTVGKAALGGPWVLVDQDGVPKTDASYKGKFCLIYFGFTYCPDICPSELVKVGNILKALEKKKCNSVQPLFISIDPARDSIGQLKHYSQDFHKDIVYLTGTRNQIADIAKAFRVYFSKANEEDEDNYLVDHSIVLYLISPEGEFLEFFTQRVQVTDIVDKILSYTNKK